MGSDIIRSFQGLRPRTPTEGAGGASPSGSPNHFQCYFRGSRFRTSVNAYPTPTWPRLLVAAPRKSSGKTLVTLGLAAALSSRGLKVQTFKRGPDYIDPLWLGRASGGLCRNLDVYFMGEAGIRRRFREFGAGADLSLIEGNMGLFDGRDPNGSDSAAAMARLLETPVLLVVDCRGMGMSVGPLIHGHVTFPGAPRIGGVILNQVSGSRQEAKIRAVLAQHCPLPILGVLPRSTAAVIDERHLGLVPAGERDDWGERIAAITDLVARFVDLEGVLALARSAPAPEWPSPETGIGIANGCEHPARQPVRVGYAADRAFQFYYPDNLEALARAGVELVPFSPLTDTALPPVSGLYLGGGFPEMFPEELTTNQGLRESIRREAAQGMPIYAECGGLMLLSRSIRWGEREVPMAGVLPFSVAMGQRPVGFGYMALEGTGLLPWPAAGERFRGHEFHYSRGEDLPPGLAYAYRVLEGTGLGEGRDGVVHGSVWASYAHLHADGAPGWAVAAAEFWRRGAAGS
nr:Cobyrinate a,c-diamide synthase / hydrogenobyrinic acid a,c-diamide synthase (Glutamine-hydrolysing) [uncultured bacterium]